MDVDGMGDVDLSRPSSSSLDGSIIHGLTAVVSEYGIILVVLGLVGFLLYRRFRSSHTVPVHGLLLSLPPSLCLLLADEGGAVAGGDRQTCKRWSGWRRRCGRRGICSR